ncbi:hypothetical protein [Microbulbifer sp. JMSA002]|uniref:hypothetical protein n=1 Tax=Microbulbifer sp. JMSA002 TaxID=3243368 RepID=UPI0040393361
MQDFKEYVYCPSLDGALISIRVVGPFTSQVRPLWFSFKKKALPTRDDQVIATFEAACVEGAVGAVPAEG